MYIFVYKELYIYLSPPPSLFLALSPLYLSSPPSLSFSLSLSLAISLSLSLPLSQSFLPRAGPDTRAIWLVLSPFLFIFSLLLCHVICLVIYRVEHHPDSWSSSSSSLFTIYLSFHDVSEHVIPLKMCPIQFLGGRVEIHFGSFEEDLFTREVEK